MLLFLLTKNTYIPNVQVYGSYLTSAWVVIFVKPLLQQWNFLNVKIRIISIVYLFSHSFSNPYFGPCIAFWILSDIGELYLMFVICIISNHHFWVETNSEPRLVAVICPLIVEEHEIVRISLLFTIQIHTFRCRRKHKLNMAF